MARYNLDGSLDTTFGTGGMVTTDFVGSADFASAILLQPNRKIVVAGSSAGDFALARYNSDGSLDTTFGTGGKVTTDFAGFGDSANALALQTDGRILVVGASRGDFALARYNRDGTLDPTFGAGGKVTTDFAGFLDLASDVVLLPNGRIILAGVSNSGSSAKSSDFAVAKYNANGSLDITFGTGGRVTTDISGIGDGANDAVLQPNGKIVLAGVSNTGFIATHADFALVRYNVDGSLDSTFGNGGIVTTDFGFEDGVRSHWSPTAKSLSQEGSALWRIPSRWISGLARYNLDGSLDTTFGSGGFVTTDCSARSSQRAKRIADARYARTVRRERPDFVSAASKPANHSGTRLGGGGRILRSFATALAAGG